MLGDQLTKNTFSGDQTLTVVGVHFGRVVNTNGVFGLGLSNRVLIFGGIIICVGLLFLLASRTFSPPARFGVWLLLGGTFSNVLDRIFTGGVVDIVSVAGLPSFNLADVMIVLGGLALLRALWWRPQS